MADAAYEIQKEEQRKTIEVTTANADIAKQEREIELKQKQVAVTEQSLEAEVKKKAEAEKYAAQQRAEAELISVRRTQRQSSLRHSGKRKRRRHRQKPCVLQESRKQPVSGQSVRQRHLRFRQKVLRKQKPWKEGRSICEV